MAAIVYLIGAGPGDPGLITARGLRCLGQADVVLYDHLVPPRLLRYAPPTAEKIDVGTAAPQPLEQEAICYLLAEKARDGKVVARLKWGDPFVFDRGGAEALFLHEQGVPFEVVPGVPAAIGFSAYAGVPLTYPGAGEDKKNRSDDLADPPAIDPGESKVAREAGFRRIIGEAFFAQRLDAFLKNLVGHLDALALVDFPQPLGPSSIRNSPGSISSCNACSATALSPCAER